MPTSHPQVPCPACDGTGTVLTDQKNPLRPYDRPRVACKLCGGCKVVLVEVDSAWKLLRESLDFSACLWRIWQTMPLDLHPKARLLIEDDQFCVWGSKNH